MYLYSIKVCYEDERTLVNSQGDRKDRGLFILIIALNLCLEDIPYLHNVEKTELHNPINRDIAGATAMKKDWKKQKPGWV